MSLLLASKLKAPQRRRGTVPRPRLDERLEPANQPALTLVSAPAGFGKTTLLADWVAARAERGHPTAWLSLDADDNDAPRFWHYVVAAVRTVAPELGRTTLSTLASMPDALTAAVSALVNDVATLPVGIGLVLDDYHLVDNHDIHGSMRFLVEHAPPQLRIAVASRADPPWPLARLRSRGELLEVRGADLRFTTEEAGTYLNGSMGLDLAAVDVATLGERTEGWIAALQLAALSMRDRDDTARFVHSFAGTDRFVVDYLAEEVLERQPPDVRSFLLQTAVLGRLCGPLCDAVTGRAGGQATLVDLEAANLFVVSLDDQREWYRYHHLFADVLRARLLAEQPASVAELHRRASDWYRVHDAWPEAVDHALSAHDHGRAAQLVELAAPTMRRDRQEATLRRWLEAMPSDLLAERPVLGIALVGARMATGDREGVADLLDDVERHLGDPGDPSRSAPVVFDQDEYARLPEQVAVYRAALSLLAGDTSATLAHARRALALAEPADHLRRGAATALTALARWTEGDLDEAVDRYGDAIGHFVELGHVSDVLGLSLAMADLQITQGRLRAARQTYESALSQAGRHGVVRGTADMRVGLATVLIEQNELDAAGEQLVLVDRLGEHAGLPQNAYRRRVAAALLLRARGDLDGALQLLRDAEAVYDTDFSPAVRPVAALIACTQLMRGDVGESERWAARSQLTPNDDLAYVHEFEHVTLARLLLHRRDDESTGAAVELLRRLRDAADEGGRTGPLIEVLTLLASGSADSGDRAAAVESLERALTLAARERAARVFLDSTPTVARMLRTVTLAGVAGEHRRHVLAASTTPTTSRSSPLADPLSSRELDVLRLLRGDLSGPEIARTLHVSLNTLRTHTKSIYSKLGVSSRRGAVRRASELDL
ncbi:LuxR C-terminal-related transcriptional regulator [Desertimonas flava]|uniref:LuxR C-terminal-related transcriptional regulator n=1 Tax=Desertimonas flava TaxID=2064846 RepID=UPI000E350ADA|nr:LuxR C-terminal-related transcriptional regulator [Desertimonas flava]